MLLSDGGITRARTSGALRVEPFNPDDVQPSSYDVHLGGELAVFVDDIGAVIDPMREQAPMKTIFMDEYYDLAPGRFALASTVEIVGLDATLAARVEGKSSLGRCGLSIHATAGFIDPGFSGTVTLELSNVAELPIRLRPGMPIGQLCVFTLDAPAVRPYGSPGLRSRYQGQFGVTSSKAHLG